MDPGLSSAPIYMIAGGGCGYKSLKHCLKIILLVILLVLVVYIICHIVSVKLWKHYELWTFIEEGIYTRSVNFYSRDVNFYSTYFQLSRIVSLYIKTNYNKRKSVGTYIIFKVHWPFLIWAVNVNWFSNIKSNSFLKTTFPMMPRVARHTDSASTAHPSVTSHVCIPPLPVCKRSAAALIRSFPALNTVSPSFTPMTQRV